MSDTSLIRANDESSSPTFSPKKIGDYGRKENS